MTTMNRMNVFLLGTLLVLTGLFSAAQAQVDWKTQLYRDDAKGDYKYQRKGIMNGNRIQTVYFNTTEVAHWPDGLGGEWPKYTGHNYIDGLTVLVGAKVHLPNGKTVTPIEAHYREEYDYDPVKGNQFPYDLEPLPGYFNEKNAVTPSPAVSIDSTTWPAHWPAAIRADGRATADWDGFWYGYFGRGVQNANYETFFVVDDNKDGEFKAAPYYYFPIKADSSRGGLGIRVEVRGFQWVHVLAEDCIFWHYDIVNISDHNYDSCAFGFYSDPGVGSFQQSTPSNSAYYNTALDLCYAWAEGGVGYPDNWKTGYYGYAYLESPGNGTNGIDDDEDGIVDETRDNGIDDDHDWKAFDDANHNGVWDVGEALNDDLGADGVGPYDPQYTGPDPGEADGKPTLGEPNFDLTDKDESDQIGLTAVALNILGDKSPRGVWPKNDDVMWGRMNNGFIDTLVNNTNIGIVFASGTFPLLKDKRERFSMALVYGVNLNALVFNKLTVQNIYNANYNFAEPPLKPHLTAIAADRKVYLSWDNRAEFSYDRFARKVDFEGYLVYRSTEPGFDDIKTITDAQGIARFWKPIAQFDLRDSISGPDPATVNGIGFWRGSETGLQHSFVDSSTDLRNGVQYYYAVVSYDPGNPQYGTSGLQATECSKIITQDQTGKLQFVDINCAVVTPKASAAGYVPAHVNGDFSRVTGGIGSGHAILQVVDPKSVRNKTTYRLAFTATGSVPKYTTTNYSLLRMNGAGQPDTLLKRLDAKFAGADVFSPPFDGLTAAFVNNTVTKVDSIGSGWLVWASGSVRNAGVVITPSADNLNAAKDVPWPADYELRWYNDLVDTTAFNAGPRFPRIPVHFHITNLASGQAVKFIVDDADRNSDLSFGDTIRIIENYVNASTYNLTYKMTWDRGFGLNPAPISDGDRYILKTFRPFAEGDYFEFTTDSVGISTEKARGELDKIKVVPNPYVSTAIWERPTAYVTGRGDRKILFTHLPARCTVRIYTVAGYLVKTLTKDTGADDGTLGWDLITDDGMDIAYGLYVYHVDAGEIGEHIGKFAVIK
jgi:hypothetical protein